MKIRNRIFLLGVVILLSFTGCKGGKSAKQNYKEGIGLLEDKKYEEAVAKLGQAVKDNPEKAEYYITYGMSLVETGDYVNAQIQFDKAILKKENKIIRENNKQAYRGKGICYYKEMRYEEAVSEFNKALEISELSELNLDILSYKGDAEFLMGNYKNALETYNKILEKNKNKAALYEKRAQIYSSLGDYDKALKDYDKAISLDSKFYDAYFGKYFLLLEQKKNAEAKKVLSQALAIKTKTEEEYFHVARIHFYQEDFKTAEEEFATSAEKGFTQAWYYLGQIMEKQKKYQEAIRNYEKYLEETKNIRSAAVYNQLGVCYMKTGDYKKAVKTLQEGIVVNDNSVMQKIKYNQVAAYEKLGKFDQALKKANDYMKIYPDDKEMQREIQFLKTRVVEKTNASKKQK